MLISNAYNVHFASKHNSKKSAKENYNNTEENISTKTKTNHHYPLKMVSGLLVLAMINKAVDSDDNKVMANNVPASELIMNQENENWDAVFTSEDGYDIDEISGDVIPFQLKNQEDNVEIEKNIVQNTEPVNVSSEIIYSQEPKIIKSNPYDIELNLSESQKASLDKFINSWNNNKEKYKFVEEKTNIPAELIAAIHFRESGCNFDSYMHNGDPLGQPTVHVPKGIYFDNWEDSAIDAFGCFMKYAKDLDINNPDSLYTFAERYNGFGYRNLDLPSPYVWSGTTNYQKGKFVNDGTYDSECVDKQIGIAAMLAATLGNLKIN